MLLWLDPRHNVWWSNRACPGVQHVAFRLVHDLKIWSDFIWPRMNVTPSWMSDLKCQPSSHFAKSSLETLLMSTQSPCQSWSMIALELTKGDHHSLPNAWYSMSNVCSKIEVDHEWPLVPVAILPIKRALQALQACLRVGIYQQFPLTRNTLGSPHALASAQIGSIASLQFYITHHWYFGISSDPYERCAGMFIYVNWLDWDNVEKMKHWVI